MNDRTPAPVRPEVIRLLTEEKLTVREVAERLGVTTQRIHQHIKRARELGELPLEGDVA